MSLVYILNIAGQSVWLVSHFPDLVLVAALQSVKAAPGKSESAFFIARRRLSRYNSSSGVSGVMTNSPSLTVAGLSCFGVGAVLSGGGGVSVFLSFPRLNSFRYLARVGGFTSMPFSCSFSAISWVSKPRFFIRSSVGARAKMTSFTVMLRLPSRVTLTGLSLANSNLISLTWAVVIFMLLSSVFLKGPCPGFFFLPLAVERHVRPVFTK